MVIEIKGLINSTVIYLSVTVAMNCQWIETLKESAGNESFFITDNRRFLTLYKYDDTNNNPLWSSGCFEPPPCISCANVTSNSQAKLLSGQGGGDNTENCHFICLTFALMAY